MCQNKQPKMGIQPTQLFGLSANNDDDEGYDDAVDHFGKEKVFHFVSEGEAGALISTSTLHLECCRAHAMTSNFA